MSAHKAARLFTLAALFVFAAAVATGPASATTVGEVTNVLKVAQQEGVESQTRINKLDDETAELLADYKATLQQLDTLKKYNAQLRSLISAQDDEKVQIQKDIDRVTTIDREVVPLMLSMVEGLEEFVASDVPFLASERALRVQRLRELMSRSDASPAEKFRRVLEAYQIENEYGRTIEAYSGEVTTAEGKNLTVDFLRVGRVLFMYKTQDDKDIRMWDAEQSAWLPVDSDYLLSVKKAMSIARAQAAPDMFILPIKAAETAK